MGTTSSRMSQGSYRRPTRVPKRSFSSFFICGASSSSSSPSSSNCHSENEDDPAEILVNSSQHDNIPKFTSSRKYPGLLNGTGSGLRNRKSETGPTSDITNSSDAETSNRGKYTSESKELIPLRNIEAPSSSSYIDQPSNNNNNTPVSVFNRRAGINVNTPNITINRDRTTLINHHGSASSNELGDSSSDESSSGNHNMTEVMNFRNYDSSTASVVSDSPLNSHIPRDDSLLEVGPGGLGIGREHDMSVSPSSSSEINNDVRRHSRRLLWDAFSRRPRRFNDSSSHNYFSSENDSDNLGHHDRWLLDFSGDFLGEGVGGDFRSYGNRTQGNYERRLHSRSEILERIRGGLDVNNSRSIICPTGIHSEGSCSCESILRAEETSSRASISRIVMLAEALFEVLDEIHRQPLSISIPSVSLPAPESVVNSLPVKSFEKPEISECGDDVAKCYICLAEYEEGDKIRVLPCNHEYHTTCVDKWLKEIHGVCPLCRGDVREGFTDVSTCESPSL